MDKTSATKALITRTRNLIARLAAGVSHNDATDLMIKINALTLKLDRAGESTIADELMAAKSAANAAGREAYSAQLTAAVNAARADERDAMRSDPCAWMHR